MIEITDRWGLAKRGKWNIKNKEIETPNIFFLQGDLFDPPEDSELTLSVDGSSDFKTPSSFFNFEEESDFPSAFAYPGDMIDGLVDEIGGDEKIQIIFDQAPDPDAELYVIGNAPELYKRSDRLYEKIISLRRKIDYHKLLYLPGIVQPNNMALMTYLGVDLFDSAYSETMGVEGVELSDWIGFPGTSENNSRHLLDELRLIRKSIQNHRIRELVEVRSRVEPWQVELIRKADEDFKIFSKGVPVSGDDFSVTTRESLNRPDIVRFKRRIKDRYSPPDRDVLLLFPCSARKPYFQSRTHRRFREATREIDWTSLQEVTLTSPLGAVPRELELFYPAQQYDIPVTHRWFEEEKKMILEHLQSIIEKGDYQTIISHLPESMSFVSDEIDGIDTSRGYHPTSDEAIEYLADKLKEVVGKERGDVQGFLQQNLESFSKFQFGRGGERLLDGAIIKGKYPWYKIMGDDDQRGMLVPQRGLISLTLEGAELLKKEEIALVEIDDFVPKGSVFAVGVKDADKSIRPEEEALVVYERELRGVGPAVMSGEEMIRAEKGEAIRLRHHL